MIHRLKIPAPTLRVSYQSEVISLRQQLLEMQKELKMLKTPRDQRQEKIAIPYEGGYQFVSSRDIMYCQADGNYTSIVMEQKTIVISKTLKSVCSLMANTSFIRCHQSYFVNPDKISGYSLKDGLTLQLTNNMSVPVSRRKKEQVLQVISQWHSIS